MVAGVLNALHPLGKEGFFLTETKAVAKHIRISPLKARQVANLVKGKDVREALAILDTMPQRTSRFIAKTLRSAVANAENNNDMSRDELYVYRVLVDEGPIWKRYQPRAMGRADLRRKRTSHITVVVKEKEV